MLLLISLVAGVPGCEPDAIEVVPAAESPWTRAALAGATFRAVGNEPFWNLEVHPDRLVVVTDLGSRTREVPYAFPDAGASTTTYRGVSEGGEVVLIVEERSCMDTMSGEMFEAAVTLSLGAETLRGCGRYL
jgi:putative lipoprotein